MEERKVFIINQDNIINAGCFDFAKALQTAEDVVRAYANGAVLYPDKVSQIFDETTQDRINCLPATLLNEGVCGMKWVSVFPSNKGKGVQNLSATILLSSLQTGFPIAFMEGTLCSNLRTAAVSALAAKYLAKSNPKTVGFVGAGQQARFHLLALANLFPSIESCYVASRTHDSELDFINELKRLCPKIKFVDCVSDYEKAVSNADILVSAISGQAPIIKAKWIRKGTLYLHVGGWEDEFAVVHKADKIVCDNWESVKHRTQTISRAYQAGELSEERIYCDIDKLVTGEKVGRANEDEFIYFNAVGLSYVDIALATHIYKTCLAKNEGTFISMQKGSSVLSELNGGL